MSLDKIRNFSIIAHIDHGKSTLADRLLEFTGTIEKRLMKDQILDSMDLERERGITIKSQAVRMEYEGYELNLIDTPGHVDFSYEVSRSLAACEGALLIVDATQGIEAQTLANAYLALNSDLTIIPVINKIDLPNSEVDKVLEELKNVFSFEKDEVLLASAKEGLGIKEILDAIIKRVPPPKGDEDAPLQALIFDSHYDVYRGVVSYVRIVNGKLKTGSQIKMMGMDASYEVLEIGALKVGFVKKEELLTGEVGYLISGVKDVRECRVGDTVTDFRNPAKEPLPGYKPIKPMVYCGFYPINPGDFGHMKDSLEKLQLNDAALFFEPETSAALGYGFRCGFLGLLHLEIIQERLEREYNLALIATSPNVIYKINMKGKPPIFIDNPAHFPSPAEIENIEEPYCKVTIFTPSTFVGPLMEISTDKRGIFKGMEYLDPTRVMLTYEIPLSEIISEFHDAMKSASKGYASMDYEITGYRVSKLVKMDILLNAEPVDTLSTIVHEDKAYYKGKRLVEKLKEVIPRHQFAIPIQASIGSKIIARETKPAMRKDVLAKCYGGDITRKRKLLEKQKEGKKKMKRIGTVDVPQEAFMAVLRINE